MEEKSLQAIKQTLDLMEKEKDIETQEKYIKKIKRLDKENELKMDELITTFPEIIKEFKTAIKSKEHGNNILTWMGEKLYHRTYDSTIKKNKYFWKQRDEKIGDTYLPLCYVSAYDVFINGETIPIILFINQLKSRLEILNKEGEN